MVKLSLAVADQGRKLCQKGKDELKTRNRQQLSGACPELRGFWSKNVR